MSVIVVARFAVSDVEKAKQSLISEGALMEKVTEASKKAGAVHHQMATGDGELIVIDEWPSAEAFEAFFTGDPDIPGISERAGAQVPPTVSVYQSFEAPGTF